MRRNKFPPGWDLRRVKRVLSHYESRSEEETVEDGTAFEMPGQTVMEVPTELVSNIRKLIAKHKVA